MKSWNELSNKEKFIRTLIIIPFAIIACFICYTLFRHRIKAFIAIAIILIVLVWQLVTTFLAWKRDG